MRAVDIIIKKRDGFELTSSEIEFFIQGYTNETIPDYQASAWAMAILLRGMTPAEITALTLAMAGSGETIDLSGVVPMAVDKHSTGGVGDKTSLVVEPIVAACGLPVGKMSGRGLGFTGGTLDKLESIPGFRTHLSTSEFIAQLHREGLVLSGHSADLAPADGKLYALRDVTGTVDSIALIASSIMSQKIAAGAQAIVLDVKVGLGAFMQTLEEARQLSETMVEIARLAGRKAVALLSDMNQPLGCAVGNALEVQEAIQTLHGAGPADFRQHCLYVAAHILALAGKVGSLETGLQHAQAVLDDGRAWEKFRRLVAAQGGDLAYIDNPELLPSASLTHTVLAPQEGWLAQVHARIIGETAVLLGAGRAKKDDPVDPSVGLVIHHKVGDHIRQGEALFTVHTNHPDRLAQVVQAVSQAHLWSDEPVAPLPHFHGVIGI